jgi:hypothetical protein
MMTSIVTTKRNIKLKMNIKNKKKLRKISKTKTPDHARPTMKSKGKELKSYPLQSKSFK